MAGPITQKERRAKLFILAGIVGGPAFVALISLIYAFPIPDTPWPVFFAAWIFALILFACLIITIAYRKTDEYTLSLWNAGVSVSFIVSIVLGFFGSGVEVAYHRYVLGYEQGQTPESVVAAASFLLVMISFFGAISFQHLRQVRGQAQE